MNKQEILENIAILKSMILEYKKKNRIFGVNALNTAISALQQQLTNGWIPVSESPIEYRNKYGALIPFLVCVEGTEYAFRAMYDGKHWGDGISELDVLYWQPVSKPPKEVSE